MILPANLPDVPKKVAVLVDELLHQTSLTDERRHEGHWIPLPASRLRQLLGGRYCDTVGEAVRAGIIEVNHRYFAGDFCKSYRISAQYRHPDFRELPGTRKLASRIRILPTDKPGLRLVEHFRHVTLEDTPALGWDLFSVRSVQAGQQYATRCDYNRFHSSYTGLPKAIRRRLQIAGETTVELDIANSQPLLLGINCATYGGGCHRGLGGVSSGVSLFRDLSVSGELYDVLADAAGLTRAQAKLQFLVLMFAEIPTTKRVQIWPVVSKLFPGIAAYILQAKAKDYRHLAHGLQRLESRIVVDTVAAGLVYPCVTVHDSLIVPQSKAGHAQRAIERAFRGFGSGVTVRLSPGVN